MIYCSVFEFWLKWIRLDKILLAKRKHISTTNVVARRIEFKPTLISSLFCLNNYSFSSSFTPSSSCCCCYSHCSQQVLLLSKLLPWPKNSLLATFFLVFGQHSDICKKSSSKSEKRGRKGFEKINIKQSTIIPFSQVSFL